MSFFNSIKRLFGFGEDDIEEEIGIDATVTPRSNLNPDSQTQSDTPDEEPGAEPQEEEIIIPDIREVNVDGIFEHVIKVFNDSLPPFLKESVDVEAQRKFLYETLDKSVKQHLDDVRSTLAEQMEMTRRQEMSRLRKQLREAGEKAKKNEETSGECKRQQLSAERQKRALAERIHDLENKINELHAEREQFELENKSLVNRLRVYSVQDEDVNLLREQVLSLQEQLKNATGSTPADEPDSDATMISGQELEQLKLKQEMADSMINDLNRTAAELREQLTAEQQHNSQLASQLEQTEKDIAKDAAKIVGYEKQIAEMSRQIDSLTDELNATQSELAEANENLSMMEQIRLQLEKLDDVMSKKNARIKDLQAQNESLTRRNESLTEELLSLKKTIESNLMSQARTESEMQKTIDGLRDELAGMADRGVRPAEPDSLDLPMMTEPKSRRRGRKPSAQPQVRISAIDESLESTDWLVAAPPEGSPTLPGMVADSEFGYKEPAHKNPPENDAQMSLW
ncbi:MAG: hypothetical protein K2M07_03590 [Muribaculaceae bacterium]|nr:hypothetical protein [Muribaculaceae bacterium]